MRKILILLVLVLSTSSAKVALAAGDIAAGKEKAATCAACHGADGISTQDVFPNLKGQKAGYIKIALNAYKDGTRKNAIMSGMASGLSDADIENVAAYFSSL